jgi:SAM-dependent methyltransferase
MTPLGPLRPLARFARTAVSRRRIRLGTGDRRVPLSRQFGYDRGTPVDRHYIEGFLARSSPRTGYAVGAIQGRVLEIGGRDYVDRFGVAGDAAAPGVVHHVDVLHENAGNPEATIIGDLTVPGTLPDDTYDCIICTQVLPVLWEPGRAVEHLHRALKPGGTLLVTVPGITKALTPDRDHWGDWWRFTSSSLRRLAVEAFGPDGQVFVEGFGNLQAATFFLHGLTVEELGPAGLDLHDPDFEVCIGLRAIKA